MRLRIAAVLLLVASAALAETRSYLYARSNRVHSTDIRLSLVQKLTREIGGDFLWARVGRREYLIRDAATLAEVRKLFVPVDAIAAETEALGRRMRPFERREEEIENEMEEFEDGGSAGLAAELRSVQRQLRVLEAEESRLDERGEALEKVVERQLDGLIDRAIERGIATRR